MTWLRLNLPPFSVPEDGNPFRGTSALGLRQVVQGWPEVEHKFSVVTPARAQASLQIGADACVSAMLMTPEREKYAYFSVFFLAVPHQIIVKRSVAKSLLKNDKGEVLPGNLFDRSDLRGLIVTGRSYGPLLDALLLRRSKESGIQVVGGIGSTPLEMLAFGRADYLLEYESAFAYLKEKNPQILGDMDVVVLPIAGTTTLEAGFACPRTKWGLEAVKKLNLIISKLDANELYADNIKWMSEPSKRFNKKRFDAFYQNLKRNSAIKRYDE